MNLRNRPFERKVRQLARAELAASDQMRKEYGRSRYRWYYAPVNNYLWTILPTTGWVLFVPFGQVMLALSVLGFGLVLILSRRTAIQLHRPEHSFFFLHHPVSDRVVFSDHMKSMFGLSLWMLPVFAVGLASLLRHHLSSASKWVAILLFAIAIWVACLGAVLSIVFLFRRIPSALSSLGAALCFSVPFIRLVPQSVSGAVEYGMLITPAGSFAFFASEYMRHGRFVALALFPSTMCILLGLFMFRRLRASYSTASQIEELFGPAGADETLDDLPADTLSPALAERLIRDGFRPLEEERRWLDRFIYDRLSDREKTVCRFFTGNEVTNFARHWSRGTMAAAILVAFAYLLPRMPDWVLLTPGTLAFLLALPLLGGNWVGFRDVFAASQRSPAYAAYPLGFWDVTRVLLKVNILRILAWSPMAIVVFLVLGDVVVSAGAGVSAQKALECLFVLICVQPLTVVGKFGAGSKVTRRWPLQPMANSFLGITVMLTFAACCIGLFASSGLPKLWFAAGVPAASFAYLAIYRRGHDNGYWDLCTTALTVASDYLCQLSQRIQRNI